MSADAKLKAYIDRILRCREVEDEAKQDTKDVYAELAADGYEKAIVGQVVTFLRKREKDGDKVAEQSAKFDLYLEAYERPSHAHTREERSDLGLNIQTKHEDIRTAPVTAEEQVPSSEQSEGNGSRDHQHVHSRQTDEAKHGGQDGEPAGADHATNSPVKAKGETGMVLGTGRERPLSIGLHTDGDPEARFETDSLHQDQQMDRATEGSFETGSEAAEKGREAIPAGPEGVDLNHAGAGESPATEKATVATQGEATAPTSDERVSLPVDDRSDAAANAGGDDVDGGAERATHLVTGEGAACALPASGIVIESVPPAPMKRPDFATCFPELSNAAYAHLHDEIQATGACAPIVRHGEVILDGWDRYNISRELGFNYPVQPYSGTDVLLDVIELQRAARNFTPAQEKKIAADLAKEFPHRADEIMAAFGLAGTLEAAE